MNEAIQFVTMILLGLALIFIGLIAFVRFQDCMSEERRKELERKDHE